MTIRELLDALPGAAISPYAFVAYVLLIVANVVIVWRVKRNKNLLDSLEKLPEDKRLEAIQLEMGVALPKHGLTAEQWLRSKIHQYYFMAFVAVIVCGTTIFVVAYWKDEKKTGEVGAWKNTLTIEELKIGLGKEYIRAKFGIPLISRDVSDDFGLNESIIYERYGDDKSEIQFLYKSSELIGYVLRNFSTPVLTRSIWTGQKKWSLGRSTFGDVGDTPTLYREEEITGKSKCQMEKYYFGRPGGYQDYYLSTWLTNDAESAKDPKMRIPNSLMVVASDELCSINASGNQSKKCNEILLMLACTYGEDSLG